MVQTYRQDGIVRIKIFTARCDRCNCRFEFIPGVVHSTKSEKLPKCPNCGRYKDVVVCMESR